MDADDTPKAEPVAKDPPERIIPAGELFGGRREVVIEHDGDSRAVVPIRRRSRA